MDISPDLDLKLRTARGRTLFESERDLLGEVAGLPLPRWFLDLVSTYPLIESEATLDPEDDASGLGVEMLWLTPAAMHSEAIDAYPGIAAVRRGYLPVGACLLGSGDPYFLYLSADNDDPPLTRIPHEGIDAQDELMTAAVEMVAPHLSDFLARCRFAD